MADDIKTDEKNSTDAACGSDAVVDAEGKGTEEIGAGEKPVTVPDAESKEGEPKKEV